MTNQNDEQPKMRARNALTIQSWAAVCAIREKTLPNPNKGAGQSGP